MEFFAKDGNLGLVASQVLVLWTESARSWIELLERFLWQALAAVKVEVLVDGRELARARLHDFLGSRATDDAVEEIELENHP